MCCAYVSQAVVSRAWAHLLLTGGLIAALVKSVDPDVEIKLDWPEPSQGPDGAYKDCPCLRIRGNMSLDNVFPDSVEMIDGETYVVRHVAGEIWTLPVDYGFNRCFDWDASGATAAQCKLQVDRPAWCDARWCYVNTTTCGRTVTVSQLLPGFSYSYQACGYLDTYLSPGGMHLEERKPLWAFAFGYAARSEPQSESKSLNLFLHFAASVVEELGIGSADIRYRAGISNATRRATPSTYTGCVHDIALGNLDLCLGDFWDTEERQSFGAASFIMVGNERIRLVGPTDEDEEEDLLTLLAKPFSPFAPDLWAMIFAVVLVVALSMFIFEYDRPGSDFGDMHIFSDVVKSVYLSLTSMLSASITFTPVTVSGRLISVGYSSFVVIIIASFTAETASFLIKSSMTTKVTSSLQDALERSEKICYSAGMQAMLEKQYRRMKQLGVPLDSTAFGDFADQMNDGICKYSIVGEMWPEPAWKDGKHCNFGFIGFTVLDFPTGYWVKDDLRKHFAFAVAVLRGRGIWGQLERQHGSESTCKEHVDRRLQSSDQAGAKLVEKRKFLQKADESSDRRLNAGAKSQASNSQGEDNDQEALTAHHMFGTLFIVGVCILIASIIRCVDMTRYGVSDHDKELGARLANQAEESFHLHKHHKYLLHSKDIASQFARVGVNLGKNTQSILSLEKDAQHIPHQTKTEVEQFKVLKKRISSLGKEALELETRAMKLLDDTHDIVTGFANLPGHSDAPLSRLSRQMSGSGHSIAHDLNQDSAKTEFEAEVQDVEAAIKEIEDVVTQDAALLENCAAGCSQLEESLGRDAGPSCTGTQDTSLLEDGAGCSQLEESLGTGADPSCTVTQDTGLLEDGPAGCSKLEKSLGRDADPSHWKSETPHSSPNSPLERYYL